MPTFGIEEEVFITEPEKPSVQSLYYLSKLFWKDPKFYYKGSSSNFARGKDLKYGLMSGVEFTTGVHSNIFELLADFQFKRKELSEVAEGLIVPMGHLITHDTPTNVCALQIHIGGVTNKKTYQNLAYFLPLLFLLTANSPLASGKHVGKSYRLLNCYAIGDLRNEPTYRFQDIIISKRLGTIELKIFDPCWDINRIRILLETIDKIIKIKEELPFDKKVYSKLRKKAATSGFDFDFEDLYKKLNDYYPICRSYFQNTPGDEVLKIYKLHGLLPTYQALDSSYRNSENPISIDKIYKNPAKIGLGFSTYYVLRLPYRCWKYWKDWY